MASENVEDWDQPLPSDVADEIEQNEEILTNEERQKIEIIDKLQQYVDLMAYVPTKPPTTSSNIEKLSKPTEKNLVAVDKEYSHLMEPTERKERIKRLASKYKTITTEQFERDIRQNQLKDQQKQKIFKSKQRVYYEMLNKMERQCRLQYLNAFINKFTNFIANLATSMSIPSSLEEPYDRMQRGLFCKILLTMGVQTSSQAALYYNTNEGCKYEVYHKLSHAFLSLIIKALDAASTSVTNDDDDRNVVAEFQMYNYMHERLMCAAEKKIFQKGKNEEIVRGNVTDKLFENGHDMCSKLL